MWKLKNRNSYSNSEDTQRKIKVRVLIDKNTKQIVAVFKDTNVNNLENFVCGKIYEVTAWTDKNEPVSLEPFAHVSVKPDGCSHFTLYEEDDVHLCGFDGYNDYFRLYAFAYELAVTSMEMCDTRNGTIDYLKSSLLKDYFVKDIIIEDPENDNIGITILEDEENI